MRIYSVHEGYLSYPKVWVKNPSFDNKNLNFEAKLFKLRGVILYTILNKGFSPHKEQLFYRMEAENGRNRLYRNCPGRGDVYRSKFSKSEFRKQMISAGSLMIFNLQKRKIILFRKTSFIISPP
jgi:hypothetical protein